MSYKVIINTLLSGAGLEVAKNNQNGTISHCAKSFCKISSVSTYTSLNFLDDIT